MPSDVIDWDLALSTGTRLSPKGPEMALGEAKEVVESLRSLSRIAIDPVRQCTGLVAPPHAPAAAVVDRRGWIESNIDAFRFVLHPILDRLRENSSSQIVTEVGSRLTAIQMGAVMAWLSGKVLGQYEALVPQGQTPRLMLVAPNIAQVSVALDVDPQDFQLWVCLHEETHRVQFTAVPWLSDYFSGESRSLVAAVDVPPREFLRHSRDVGSALVSVMRGNDGASALMTAVLSPEQQDVYDRISALMTLLEGHADVVMDEVGPDVVPSVAKIRARFDERRKDPGAVDSVVRRLLGMDAKMRQYSEGAAFVRGVIDAVAMPGFNAVWESPDNLPTLAEIAEPMAWVKRVHG